jgi:hypothetical protein
MNQKKYLLAAGFFLLSNHISEAINVIIHQLHDVNLAITVARILDFNL